MNENGNEFMDNLFYHDLQNLFDNYFFSNNLFK